MSIMKPIVCKYRLLLEYESISYELWANKLPVSLRDASQQGYELGAKGPESYQVPVCEAAN